ncbi:class I mannose-6-phosphate isomerase [Paramicrobacterium agarici]|uniref:class I mannose-6-phosphate isomerase n=1 Tax=Paramicrobacterium agarici TaxID=630514 RepID=UPI001FE993E8|nr:class I mannose-6-phosphate isomerase [Microbacterium agarici]
MWLGGAHVEAFGTDTKLLVKLLDAGQRLPVHFHPSGIFARQNLGAAHGKAEAWYILEAGDVFLGFNREVRQHEIRGWMAAQDHEAMLAAMHRIAVSSGDRIYVHPGMPHAIGAGVFLVEVQEPEDMSVLLEWGQFELDGENEGHLGLGFGRALTALDLTAWSRSGINAFVVRADDESHGLPPGAAPYFRMSRLMVRGTTHLEASFGILIVVDGEASLETDGIRNVVREGETILVPFGAGPIALTGDAHLVYCAPPLMQK